MDKFFSVCHTLIIHIRRPFTKPQVRFFSLYRGKKENTSDLTMLLTLLGHLICFAWSKACFGETKDIQLASKQICFRQAYRHISRHRWLLRRCRRHSLLPRRMDRVRADGRASGFLCHGVCGRATRCVSPRQ